MPRPRTETIPAAPFVDWLNHEADRLRANSTRIEAGQVNVHFRAILAQRLGTSERSIYRYMRSLDGNNHPTDAYERRHIETLLDHADIHPWEIYPDPGGDHHPGDAYCPHCHDDVTTLDDRCAWCTGPTLPTRPPGSTSRRGQGRRMTDDQVRAAHTIYTKLGIGTVELGRLLWQRYGYTSAWRCTQALQRSFHSLNLPVRPMYRHSPAFQAHRDTRCRATTRAGNPCRGMPHDGTDLCPAHLPGSAERARAALQHAHRTRRETFQNPLNDDLLRRARIMHIEQGLSINTIATLLAPETGRAQATIYGYLRPRAHNEGWYLGPTPHRPHAQEAAA